MNDNLHYLPELATQGKRTDSAQWIRNLLARSAMDVFPTAAHMRETQPGDAGSTDGAAEVGSGPRQSKREARIARNRATDEGG